MPSTLLCANQSDAVASSTALYSHFVLPTRWLSMAGSGGHELGS